MGLKTPTAVCGHRPDEAGQLASNGNRRDRFARAIFWIGDALRTELIRFRSTRAEAQLNAPWLHREVAHVLVEFVPMPYILRTKARHDQAHQDWPN